MSKPEDTRREESAVPPPPPTPIEVSVRTMESDLEYMGRSLEEASQSASAAPAQVQERQVSSSLASILSEPEPETSRNRANLFIWGIVVAVGVIVFFFTGYFFLPLILEEKSAEQTPPAASAPADLSATKPAPVSPVFLGHQSFLRSSPDETFDLQFSGQANPAYYNLYLSDLSAILSQAKNGSKFVEVKLTRSDGQAFAWTQILALLGVSAVKKNFWLDRFEQDFTFFAYREGGVWYPGYIIKLKTGQSPLILQPAVLKIESDANLKNFFLTPPGEAQDNFRDAQISGQPVRLQDWSEFDSALVYGWLYNQYLVISASEVGYREAMLRL